MEILFTKRSVSNYLSQPQPINLKYRWKKSILVLKKKTIIIMKK